MRGYFRNSAVLFCIRFFSCPGHFLHPDSTIPLNSRLSVVFDDEISGSVKGPVVRLLPLPHFLGGNNSGKHGNSPGTMRGFPAGINEAVYSNVTMAEAGWGLRWRGGRNRGRVIFRIRAGCPSLSIPRVPPSRADYLSGDSCRLM